MSLYPKATRSPTTRASRPAPRALTLIEMLIGMAITLVMMAAVVNLFANIGSGIRVQRVRMEMGGQLRTARSRLFMDLAGATCDGIPKGSPEDNLKADGYIEIVEGQFSDKDPSGLLDGNAGNGELNYAVSQVPSSNLPLSAGNVTDGGGLGDYDDILALTVHSNSEPFVGRGLLPASTNGPYTVEGTIESNEAEVIWYAVENPADGSLGEPGMRTVYRRVLLIATWIGPIDPTTLSPPVASANEFFRRFDISARFDSGLWIPNTLADLVRRENRFAHLSNAANYPHVLMQDAITPNTTPPAFPTGATSPLHPFGAPFETIGVTPDRQGEDVMLNDVLAFDLRVFDPGAPLYEVAGAVTEPSDFGWSTAGTLRGYGAYVDLGWEPTYPAAPLSSNEPEPLFQLRHQAGWHPISSPAPGYPAVYDTWSYHYETDGIDQDNVAGIDQGTNGLDDNVGTGATNGTDDIGERETAPPYDVPLHGIQVKIRTYEPDTRQIREATVTRGF